MYGEKAQAMIVCYRSYMFFGIPAGITPPEGIRAIRIMAKTSCDAVA